MAAMSALKALITTHLWSCALAFSKRSRRLSIISSISLVTIGAFVSWEKYLKVFLEDGEVPIDNSASERALRTFTIGRKGWVLINSIKGANASAVIYSITETAKLNGLNPYYYLDHLL